MIDTLKNYRYIILVGILCFLAGKYIFPPDKEVQVKEVVKYVTVKEEVVKEVVIQRKREEKRPDGTIIVETVSETIDSTETRNSTNLTQDKIKITSKKKSLSLGLLALKPLDNFNQKTEFQVLTIAPLFGNLSIAGSIDSSKKIGVGLVLEF